MVAQGRARARKKKDKKKPKNLSISAEVCRKLAEYSARTGIAQSALAEQGLLLRFAQLEERYH